ncbi:protein CIP2A [Synchiropus splendidus]|uniref:protein CIP2A n=1 Tax=Synchiropus splendidus TaxID=270530 RepID=UPI00237D9855|nr:protein CIP2A [Synchiropus splendidus]
MDRSTALKSLLLAVQQYRASRTALNATKLQKQVEELSGLQVDWLLSSGQVLPTECVSGLVELIGNQNTSPDLSGTIVSLLAQLAGDDCSRQILHSSFSLTSSLASVLHRYSATPAEPLVLQSLQVLQKLTYHTQVSPSTSYIHELLAFLITNIQSQDDDIIMPCLGVMANLCRDNPALQSHIKSLEQLKPFYRSLINFLAHNSLTVVVFALSILASLTLNEKVGEKLFDAKNIHQTFQLVFNIVVNGDGTLTRKYSVDLLVDLLRNPKIAEYLSRYQHFSACVTQVLGLLQSKDPDSAAKVLELLLAVCRVSGLRPLLCQVVFRPVGAKVRVGRTNKAEPGLALVQWLSAPVEGGERCALQTLELLQELLEEALESTSDSALSFLEMLLPVLLGLLDQGGMDLRQRCRRTTRVTRLLLTLCARDSSRSLVSRHLSAPLLLSQAESLMSCPVRASDADLSQLSADSLLKTVELMSRLRQQVPDMETGFYRTLQDQRMVGPLALALTSHHRELVQTGLSLLLEATPLPDFPSLTLGESIAANNAYRQREAELAVKHAPLQEVPPLRSSGSFLDVSVGSGGGGVGGLVEKIQTHLELQDPTKEPRVSDIIEVYEQQLATFASKESRLQDLLEAKALALSQADRLIAQYHFQRAQAEAEARQLGSLLKEAERRREDLQVELSSQVLEVERSRADMEELLQHNARLQRDSEEHQALKGAYNASLNRLGDGERQLKELQAAHGSLSRHADSQKKSLEALQQQHDRTLVLLDQRQQELLSLQARLQQKDADLTQLQGALQEQQQQGREKDGEKRALEETLDLLKKELNKTEQARKEASIKASSLELQKSQLEAKLQQKEEELSKHSAMIAMIHSLSSGKMKNDVNLSL